ncbi:hypothetical protein AGMMS49587_02220 [Spirochaetia bacterium]|nr:hypothetical protein AGMMS49587_02220 [Spirochaetia bacterium]
MKKNIRAAAVLFAVVFALAGVPGVFSLTVSGDAPETNIPVLNTALGTAWTQLITDLNNNDLLKNLRSEPENLIKSFGTASIFASQGATQRGYGEPKRFTFTVGPMVGIKTGQSLGDVLGNLHGFADSIGRDIKNNGDAALGLNLQALSGQFSLNTSKFLLKGLDLGVRFGYFNLSKDKAPGFAFKTASFGLVANYQLFKEKNLVPVVLKWRGLSLGTGVIYTKSKIAYSIAFGEAGDFNQPLSYLTSGDLGTLKLNPKLVFDMETNTVTVPLEATTAIQLFSFLNITLGVGADLGFGKNKMTLGVTSDVNIDPAGAAIGFQQTNPGSLSVTGGGKGAPQAFNFKVMTGVGFKFGPVILDMPFTWYPGDGLGASVGLTLGFTF